MNKLFLILLLLLGLFVMPVSASWTGVTDTVETVPYIGALWSDFQPLAGDVQSATFAHSGTRSWKVENGTRWQLDRPADVDGFSASIWVKMNAPMDYINIIHTDLFIQVLYSNDTTAQLTVTNNIDSATITIPYNYVTSPWVKIMATAIGNTIRCSMGDRSVSIGYDMVNCTSVWVEAWATGETVYADDINIQYHGVVTESPLVNSMLPLIAILGLVGLALPLLAVSGGSSIDKAVKIMIYLIVVGALISSAFVWF